jgi:hypothetical protein
MIRLMARGCDVIAFFLEKRERERETTALNKLAYLINNALCYYFGNIETNLNQWVKYCRFFFVQLYCSGCKVFFYTPATGLLLYDAHYKLALKTNKMTSIFLLAFV